MYFSVCGNGEAAILAFNFESATPEWIYGSGSPCSSYTGAIYNSFAHTVDVTTQKVPGQSPWTVTRVNAGTGGVVWHTTLNASATSTPEVVPAATLLTGDLVIAGQWSLESWISVINSEHGKPIWNTTLPYRTVQLMAQESLLLAYATTTSNGVLYAIEVQTGAVSWTSSSYNGYTVLMTTLFDSYGATLMAVACEAGRTVCVRDMYNANITEVNFKDLIVSLKGIGTTFIAVTATVKSASPQLSSELWSFNISTPTVPPVKLLHGSYITNVQIDDSRRVFAQVDDNLYMLTDSCNTSNPQ